MAFEWSFISKQMDEWQGGRHIGTIWNGGATIYVSMFLGKNRISTGIRISANGTAAAMALAKETREKWSLFYGKTKNRWCIRPHPDTQVDCIYVDLGKYGIMYCDVQDLPLVQQYCWSGRKSQRPHKDRYTSYARGYANNEWFFFHDKLLGTKPIDHLNGNGLDNRREN